ncbi:MAG: ASCH domain-containing protein [Acidobacteria bacterium]|nr:ASCH domain-containing protein [Acidobacteriota bacterium]
MIKALTVRPVWAWAIIHAGKNIENRTWRTQLRGTIAIHASKGLTRAEYKADVKRLPRRWQKEIPAFEDMTRGAIVGIVDLVDCVTESKSRWYNGEDYGFVLRNARAVKSIECTGALGFWDLPVKVEQNINRLIRG